MPKSLEKKVKPIFRVRSKVVVRQKTRTGGERIFHGTVTALPGVGRGAGRYTVKDKESGELRRPYESEMESAIDRLAEGR